MASRVFSSARRVEASRLLLEPTTADLSRDTAARNDDLANLKLDSQLEGEEAAGGNVTPLPENRLTHDP
ncbi:MAG: hypothetical protein F4Z04_04360 [Acidobacteria bacterium]|nr:hypothetical protein [Acidobacteriota bacterium]